MNDILLVEPGYRNKYPPLGLMKLAAFHRSRGDRVTFHKHGHGHLPERKYSRAYVTTLFSFEWRRTARAIDWVLGHPGLAPESVFIGGIAASLVPSAFTNEPRWNGVTTIKGLLTRETEQALRLQAHTTSGAGGPTIDETPPYYGWLEAEDRAAVFPYRYPVEDAYFGYSSRGCVRKCHFCGVPQLEGDQTVRHGLSRWVDAIVLPHEFCPENTRILTAQTANRGRSEHE